LVEWWTRGGHFGCILDAAGASTFGGLLLLKYPGLFLGDWMFGHPFSSPVWRETKRVDRGAKAGSRALLTDDGLSEDKEEEGDWDAMDQRRSSSPEGH
jgi:hypothetical protein